MSKIKLNHLNAVLNCTSKTIDPDHSKIHIFAEKGLSFPLLYTKRIFYFIRTGRWNNNKRAAKAVRYYLYKASTDEQNSTKGKQLQKILEKLQKLGNAKSLKVDTIDKAWLDAVPDQKDSFKRVKGVPNLNFKTLFHIHANSFGANNKSLEGSTPLEQLSYINAYLNQRKAQNLHCFGLPDSLLEQLKDAALLADNFKAHAVSKITEAFIQQKPLLIPGGWVGTPGHALYYEIIPTGDKANIRLYGLGAGSSENQFGATVGNKEKYLPFVELVGVSKTRLLDPSTIQAMNELNHSLTINPSDIKTDYSEKDIYKGLINLLSPEQVSKNEKEVKIENLHGLQQAGVCSYRSLLAFLSTKLSKEDYQNFVIGINLQSLLDKVDQVGKSTLSDNQWHLLKKSQQRLNRKISKAYEQSFIGNRYAFKAYEKLREVSNWLDEKHEETFDPKIPQVNKISQTWRNRIISSLIEVDNSHPPLHTLTKASPNHSTQTYSNIYDEVCNLGNHLQTDLPALLKIAEHAKSTSQHAALQVSMIKYFTDLDIDQALQSCQDEGDKKTSLPIWGNCLKYFLKAAYCRINPMSCIQKGPMCF